MGQAQAALLCNNGHRHCRGQIINDNDNVCRTFLEIAFKFRHHTPGQLVEADALNTEAATLYKNYQNEVVFLSQEQKQARQQAINEKEKQAAELKRKYFGPDGELFKKRTSLMTPIQEEIYNAVKDICDLRGYSLVLDRASDTGIIFGSPKIDISNEVLSKLGYSN